MELLVITWNYPPRRGGMEKLMASLCGELRKKYAVHLITAHAPSSMADEAGVYRAPWPGLFVFAVYALWRGAVLLSGRRQIRCVFGGSAMVAPLVFVLARAFRRRAAVQIHGLDVIYRNVVYQQLCIRWLKACDRVIANSRYTARMAETKGVVTDRIAVISPGVEFDRFDEPGDSAADKRSWGAEDRQIVLYVGRLARRKGVKEFIENSFVEIQQIVPPVIFLIVGDNPTESLVHRRDAAGEIKSTVAALRLENHVRLLGVLSDDEVMHLYRACDLVILPVLETTDDVEGFGLVALEAAAAAKPVVATRVGGIPDAVEDGKSGTLVNPGDYAALSRAVIELLTDDEKRLSLGAYARERVRNELSWNRVVESYVTVFIALDQGSNHGLNSRGLNS